MGNSVSVLCRPKVAGIYEPVYAGRLPRLCRDRGVDVDVINQARWFERINTGWRRWDRDVSPFLPAVVVVNYGFAECQPFVVPHVVHRALLDWKLHLNPVNAVGRRLFVETGRHLVGRATTKVAVAVGQRTHKLPPKRFEAELERFIRSCRGELGALVLVIGLSPPGEEMVRFQPGIEERRTHFDRIEREVVARFGDPLVQFVDVEPMFATLGAKSASSDGLHLTAAGHEHLAGLLADQIATHLAEVTAGR